MGKKQAPINTLSQFLPPGSWELIAPYFQTHTIQLTLTRERKSLLGDYRNPIPRQPQHKISININLNPYSFLITLLHELAHMLNYIAHGHTVQPHGSEWKKEFRTALIPFLGKSFFPTDIEKALIAYLSNPAASTCTDIALYKALYKYDQNKPGYYLLDDLPDNATFSDDEGIVFQKIHKIRTRIKIKMLSNSKFFLASPIMEVKFLSK